MAACGDLTEDIQFLRCLRAGQSPDKLETDVPTSGQPHRCLPNIGFEVLLGFCISLETSLNGDPPFSVSRRCSCGVVLRPDVHTTYEVQVGRSEKTCKRGYAITRVYFGLRLLLFFLLILFQLLAFWHVLSEVQSEVASITAAVIGVMFRRYAVNEPLTLGVIL